MTTKKGGGLPNVLIPLGLIVARGGVPKLVRSLKRILTKKGGGRKRRRTVRKRRRTRKGRRTRRTLRGGKFGSCTSCQVGGMIMGETALKRLEEQIRTMLEGTIHEREEAHDILKEMKNNTTDKGQRELAIKINESLESPKSPKGKKKGIKTKGKRTKGKRKRTKRKTKSLLPCCIPCPPHASDTDACLLPCQRCVPLKTKRKRTKGKRTKGKQKGGFMRGATRDFCQIKN